MAKTETTKIIENLLTRTYNPAELAGQRLNKMRPHFVVTECVVETGTNIGGIVDAVRIDETLVEEKAISICHGKETSFKDFFSECGKPVGELPYYCDNESCIYNRKAKVQSHELLITCFEIKVTKSDFHSKNGHNFVGNANYYVMPIDLYKEVKDEIPDNIGVIVFIDGEKTYMLRKMKESAYTTIDDNTRMWMVLNVLKKYGKDCYMRGGNYIEHKAQTIF